MQLIANGTQVSSVPTPATPVGTPGYISNTPPGPLVVPTVIDPDAHNALLAEVVNTIIASGQTITPGNFTQLLSAILAFGPQGQCKLSVASSTSLQLLPSNGRRIVINGAGYQIPQAGISIANTGLSPDTLYYVYVYNASGTLALELSATGHATDATTYNYGVEIKSGDSTRTLVGAIVTGAGTPGIFADTLAYRGCRNWFGRKSVPLSGAISSAVTSTSPTPVDVGSACHVVFFTWGDEAVSIRAGGIASNNASGNSCSINGGIDGTVETPILGEMYSAAANQTTGLFADFEGYLAEGVHTATPMVAVSAGTGTFNVAIIGAVHG